MDHLHKKMSFPIDSWLPEIQQSLDSSSSVIIKASPGAGKTTRVPLAMLAVGYKIIMVQPRRIATKLSAEWMAKALGEEIGQTVGYQIRFDSKYSSKTKILVVTEGILTRRLMDDPLLADFDVVILDEFHERNINGDMALSLINQIMQSRQALKLVVMSATLETNDLEKYLNHPKVFDIPGRAFPIELEYHPPKSPGGGRLWEEHVTAMIVQMRHDPRCLGHILVFLTGAAEIRSVAQRLKLRQRVGQILILTSETTQEFIQQFYQSDDAKIILATNVAETSITLPGVNGVIDGGYAKQSGFAAWNGLPTLEIQKISQASCIQRSGRAGRTAPGLCYRLFGEVDFCSRPSFTEPEIRRADLCQTLLELKLICKKLDLAAFHWFEDPKPSQIDASESLLLALGALDKNLQLTVDGEKMVHWPFHPRLGRILLEGIREGITEAALLGVILFNEGMVSHLEFRPQESQFCDLYYLINLFLTDKLQRNDLFDPHKIQRIRRIYRDMQSQLECGFPEQALEANPELLRKCIFMAFADRVAKLRATETTKNQMHKKAIYHFCFGKEGVLQGTSVIDHRPWIVTLEAQESLQQEGGSRRGKILWASSIEESWLYQDPFGLIRSTGETMIDPKNNRPCHVEAIYYQDILIAKELTQLSAYESGKEVILQGLKDRWEQSFDKLAALKVYHWKLATLDRFQISHNMPRIEGEYLEILLHMIVDGVPSLDHALGGDLDASLRDLLDDADRDLLRRVFPENLVLVGGKSLRIHYSEESVPILKGKIQDFYGHNIHPTVCLGKLPLVIHMLAPNQRPVQVTADLPGFWRTSYDLVKKELKARYPRHSWPEDPTQVTPPYKKRF